MFGLVACAVEANPDPEPPADADDAEIPTSEPTNNGAPSPGISCYRAFECVPCTLHRTRNLLVEICSDGTETLVQRSACGQACF